MGYLEFNQRNVRQGDRSVQGGFTRLYHLSGFRHQTSDSQIRGIHSKLATETAEPVEIKEEFEGESSVSDSAQQTDESIRKMTEKLSSDIQNSISSFFGEYLPASTSLPEDTAKEVAVFLEDPQDTEKYAQWQEGFVLEERTEDISRLLNADSFLRHVHTQLVPKRVTSVDFWKRHYFSAFETEEKERKRAAILARAKAAIVEEDEEEIGWSDNEDEDEEIQTSPVIEIENTLESSTIPNDPGAGSPPSSHEFTLPEDSSSLGDLYEDLDNLLDDLGDIEPDEGIEEIEFDDYDDWE